MSRPIPSQRSAGIRAVSCCVLGVMAIASIGSIGRAERYMVGDLQLISWESVQDANESWSGPVEAATILAWYAAHGHSWILPDLNDDGFIDEEDTAHLAVILGREFMETDASSGTSDPALVWGIGAFLAEVAPGRFGIRVYDAGFDEEWLDRPPGWLGPDEIPGVSVEILDDAFLTDFRTEMAGGALTILGLKGLDNQPNVYVAGRSFNGGPQGSVVAEVGLVSSYDDPCRIGIQGRIIDTTSKSTTAWRVSVDGMWYEIEFMLALWALWATEPDISSDTTPAPDLAAAVESTSSCENSSQEDGVACTIRWATTISNNNPEYRVPRGFKVEQRIDLAPESPGTSQTQYLPKYVVGDLLRELNETGLVVIEGSFTWFTDPTGISDGEYEVFVLADARCEIDEFTSLAEANNVAVARGDFSSERDGGVPVGTLDPGEAGGDIPATPVNTVPMEERCADLAVEIVSTSCEWEHGYHSLDYTYTVEVTVRVSNLGNLIAGTFWVRANGTYGSDSKAIFGLAAGESTLVKLSYDYMTNMAGVTDVVEVRVPVRFQECSISNNNASSVVCD